MSAFRPHRLELSPSTSFAGAVLAVHATAAACLLATMPGVAAPALAILIVGLGAVSAWERALLRGSRAPRVIEVAGSGSAAVILANGKAIEVRPVRGIGVTRYWVALAPATVAGGAVFVTAGMLSPAQMRILRLWALWGRTPAAAWRPA